MNYKSPPPDSLSPEALNQLILWLRDKEPCFHVRFGDGEFNAILNRPDLPGCSQQPITVELGIAIAETLYGLCRCDRKFMQVGVNWASNQKLYYPCISSYINILPLCPAQVFVDSIICGKTLEFLKVIAEDKRPKFLVCNNLVSMACESLRMCWVPVPEQDAWSYLSQIKTVLDSLCHAPKSVWLWAAGAATKPHSFRLWEKFPHTTHIDIGHLLDGAFGLKSRCWLGGTPDLRQTTYHETITPFLRGSLC